MAVFERNGAGPALTLLPRYAHARADGESGPSESNPAMEAALRTRIIAQPSAVNPNECRFMVDANLREGRMLKFADQAQAATSPLAQRLFELPQVRNVTVVGNVLTVTKDGDAPWQEVARKIGTAIRLFLASGEPVVLVEPEFPSSGVSNEELAERVQKVIDTLINPGLAGHGGFVRLTRVEADTAWVIMGGGCHGCGMAAFTMRDGVAQTITQHVPEIQQVLDATDHSSGQNPFYASRG